VKRIGKGLFPIVADEVEYDTGVKGEIARNATGMCRVISLLTIILCAS
jgi:hypothetical protein